MVSKGVLVRGGLLGSILGPIERVLEALWYIWVYACADVGIIG